MLTSWLINRLDRADNPRAIQFYSHALERVTGVSEQAVLSHLQRKDTIIGSFSTTDNASEEVRKYYATYPGIAQALGSYSSYTGQAVNSDSALGLSAVYACVKILGEDMGSLPFNFYLRSDNGKTTDFAWDDERFAMLHDLANPDTSAGEFVEALTANAAMGLDGFAKIERNSKGRPIWMYQISPEFVTIERNANNQTVYKVKEKAGAPATVYARKDIFHLKGFSFNGLAGDPILQRARHILGIGLATQEYAGRFFSNDASTGIILKRPIGAPGLGPEALANLKTGWKLWHQGVAKSHEPAVVQEGTEVMRIDPDLEKLQIIPVRKFQIQEVARLWRMPLHKLADLERAIQCLPGDALVFTASGPKPIAEIEVGELVWSRTRGCIGIEAVDQTSIEGGEWQLSRVSATGASGEDRILRIHAGLRTLRCNARHVVPIRRRVAVPFTGGKGRCTKRGEERFRFEWKTVWVQAKDIVLGDELVAASKLPDAGGCACPTRGECSVAFMECLGMIVGDGFFMGGRGFGVSHAEAADYMAYYNAAFESEFSAYTSHWKTGTRNVKATRRDKTTTVFYSQIAALELEEIGIAGTAKTKTLPPWIFSVSHELKSGFLRGYLDADGTVNKRGDIRFVSVNRRLIEQVRHLCMDVGIRCCNVFSSDIKSEFNGKPYTHTLHGFECSNAEMNAALGTHTAEYSKRTRAKVLRAPQRNVHVYPHEQKRRACGDGITYTKVDRIEEEPDAAVVYDLTVEGNHTFIADGVLVHNSNVEQQAVEYSSNTLSPWRRRWKDAVHRCLLTREEQIAGKLYAEHNLEAYVRGDFRTQSESFARLLEKGVYSINEVRRWLNLNPAEGGDAHYVQLNMASISDAASGAMIDQGSKLLRQGPPQEA